MLERQGIPVSQGVVIAEAFVIDREDVTIRHRFVTAETMPEEVVRLQRAFEAVTREIEVFQQKADREVGPGSAAIFQAHAWILRDPEFHTDVFDRVESNHFTAEYAIDRTIRKYIGKLRATGVPYMIERIVDLEDIERRLINQLQGADRRGLDHLERPVVLVAHDLTPSQTLDLDRAKILALATDAGGRTSHTAILARDLGIPAVVGLGDITAHVSPGDIVIVDGNYGTIVIAPDDATHERYLAQRRSFVQFSDRLHEERDLPAVTPDGVAVEILGNIEFPGEIEQVLTRGGTGIGLYRTEFLFLESERLPNEEAHLQAYEKAVDLLQGRPIAIRTFDLGGDKVYGDAAAHRERNPFLGCRSIRICRERPDIFRPQLSAILQVSTQAPVSLMLPMICTLEEIRWARAQIEEVKEELARRRLPFHPTIPVGIMVEVPAAALSARDFAREVDFFSIGTNDLVQYTLAVDRTNERVASLFVPVHPAVLRLVREVIDAAGEADIPVGICGEMAGESIYTALLLGMGLRSFSVAPTIIPEVKKIVRSIDTAAARAISDEVAEMNDTNRILAFLREKTREILPESVGRFA